MDRPLKPDFLYRDSGDLPDEIRRRSTSLKTTDDLDPLIDRVGDARVVMLGEATHGTSDFYTWRAKLSKRLIEEEGFSFVAVEGDWPACYRLNRFVKRYDGADDEALDVAGRFRRWPTWMWANWEVVAFIDWMRRFNDQQPDPDKSGFYGLDIYSLHDSISALIEFLKIRDPEGLQAAHRALRCFEPHGLRGRDYARATSMVDADCREEAVELLSHVFARGPEFEDRAEADLSARQNARLVVNAERYYRRMMGGGADAWNLRDRHMARTLDDLLAFHGPDSRAIVWEHNTHVGDARFTDMYANGMVNLGQLGRQQYGDHDTVLVGFTTHRGHVIAGPSWGAPMVEYELPEAAPGSWEDIFFRAGGGDRLLITDELRELTKFQHPRGHRAIGVVYQPHLEDPGNYVPTNLPQRYDAVVYIDESEALHPLHIEPSPVPIPETFPWGV